MSVAGHRQVPEPEVPELQLALQRAQVQQPEPELLLEPELQQVLPPAPQRVPEVRLALVMQSGPEPGLRLVLVPELEQPLQVPRLVLQARQPSVQQPQAPSTRVQQASVQAQQLSVTARPQAMVQSVQQLQQVPSMQVVPQAPDVRMAAPSQVRRMQTATPLAAWLAAQPELQAMPQPA